VSKRQKSARGSGDRLRYGGFIFDIDGNNLEPV
jgi:hypothetical protein